MLVGEVGIDGAFEVVAGRGGAEDDGASVDLVAVLQDCDLLSGAADADKEETRGEWVEGASVAYLDVFDAVEATENGLDFVHCLERGPAAWFVDREDEAGLNLVEGEHERCYCRKMTVMPTTAQ